MAGIEQLRARLGFGSLASDENPEVAPLTVEDARQLRLPWLSKFNSATLAAHLRAYPRMSMWVPRTSEYLVAEPWRRREEIANIVEVTARKGKRALVSTLLDRFRSQGQRLAMLSGEVWHDQSRLYVDLGFERIETIVFFHKTLRSRKGDLEQTSTPNTQPPVLQYRRLSMADMSTLLRMDHASFPWLWWNSAAEFETYMVLPNVYMYAAEFEGVPIGYTSFTIYKGWAHLDRLSVVEPMQGRGYGVAQLVYALRRMSAMGAETVSLSTQLTNVQSHRLYTGFGFKQSSESMHFYGIKLDPDLRLTYVHD